MSVLENQVAVITGAGSGIGRAAAKLLAEAGAKVIVVGRRLEPLNSVIEEIQAAGGEGTAHSADLSDGTAAAGGVTQGTPGLAS